MKIQTATLNNIGGYSTIGGVALMLFGLALHSLIFFGGLGIIVAGTILIAATADVKREESK